MHRPKVIRAGKDPDCIHREYIDTNLIGTCCKCGQVRSYRDAEIADDPPVKSLETMSSCKEP